MEFEEYLNLSFNRLIGLPETKRDLFYCFMELIKDGGGESVVLVGNRRVGKTTLFKQLAAEVPDALYVSFELAEDTYDAWTLVDGIIDGILSGKYKTIFLDEVTKAFYYDEKLKTIVDIAWQHGVSVFITSSCKRYLQQLAHGMLGARVHLIEMRGLSYLEYLFMFGGAKGQRKYSMSWDIEEIETVLQELDKIGVSKESFLDYLVYIQRYGFTGGVTDYIESSYSDLIGSEQALSIVRGEKINGVDFEVAKKLLYAQQYALITAYRNKMMFFKAAGSYGRERDALGMLNVKVAKKVTSNLDTELSKRLAALNERKREELCNALSLLYQIGLVKKVCTIESGEDIEDVIMEARREREECKTLTVDDIFSSLYVVSDVGTYLCILRDFLSELNISLEREVLRGSLFGEIIEYFVRSQVMDVAGEEIGFKLKCSELQNAKEIDVYSRKLSLLIEVGVGGKSAKDLAFCDSEFSKKYPDYVNCERVYVSSGFTQEGSILPYKKHSGYTEVAYWVFIAYADTIINGQIVKRLHLL